MESHAHLYLCYCKTAALRELSLMKAELVLETPLIRNKHGDGYHLHIFICSILESIIQVGKHWLCGKLLCGIVQSRDLNIDYYTLRAWYRFYSLETRNLKKFLIPYRERASLQESERYGIKNEWIKTISGS